MFLIGLLVIAERIGVVEMRRIIGRASRATYDAAEEQAERECATKLPRFKTLLLFIPFLFGLSFSGAISVAGADEMGDQSSVGRTGEFARSSRRL